MTGSSGYFYYINDWVPTRLPAHQCVADAWRVKQAPTPLEKRQSAEAVSKAEADYVAKWWENYHAVEAINEARKQAAACEHRYFVWGQRAGVILWTGVAICLILLAFA